MRIESFKNDNETILWTGKPNKAVFIKEHIFSPMLIFVVIWLLADAGALIMIFSSADMFQEELFFIIPFFAFHLAPVWIYLFKLIFAFKKWKNTEYMVTDKAIYSLTGIFTTNCDRKTFQEVTNVSVHQGIIDKRHNVGDVFIVTGARTDSNGRTSRTGINIIDIEDYMEVYKLISKTGQDIFSDTMYPNDLRPRENRGYQTEYTPNDK